jgi:hypothetical protein
LKKIQEDQSLISSNGEDEHKILKFQKRDYESKVATNRMRIKYGWMKYLYIAVLIMIVILNIAIAYWLFTQDKNNALFAEERTIECTDMMATISMEISTGQDEVEALSYELYDHVKDICTNTEDELVKRLFEQEFPSDETYLNDPYTGFITLEAMLNNHPEIKSEAEILETLEAIYVAQVQIESNVDSYNTYLEYYQFWAEEYNTSMYAWNKESIDTTKYSEMKVQY